MSKYMNAVISYMNLAKWASSEQVRGRVASFCIAAGFGERFGRQGSISHDSPLYRIDFGNYAM